MRSPFSPEDHACPSSAPAAAEPGLLERPRSTRVRTGGIRRRRHPGRNPGRAGADPLADAARCGPLARDGHAAGTWSVCAGGGSEPRQADRRARIGWPRRAPGHDGARQVPGQRPGWYRGDQRGMRFTRPVGQRPGIRPVCVRRGTPCGGRLAPGCRVLLSGGTDGPSHRRLRTRGGVAEAGAVAGPSCGRRPALRAIADESGQPAHAAVEIDLAIRRLRQALGAARRFAV